MRRMRCVLVCEDREQERFFRPVLERVFKRPVRVQVGGGRVGGGIAYVRRQFAIEVKIVRQRHQEASGLVVAIDGDAVGQVQRCRELDEVLRKSGEHGLDASERVAVCVPTRTIETWEVWFCDRDQVSIDESTDYKSWVTPDHARRAAKAWFDSPPEDEKMSVPSLSRARQELARLAKLSGL